MANIPMRLAQSPEDYHKLGVAPGAYVAREGRMHVDGRPGTLEWWFMKADIGECNVVIGLLTAPNFRAELGLQPQASVFVIFPDGRAVARFGVLTAEDFESRSDQDSDVRAGKCFFRGHDLRSYRAHFEVDDFIADIELTPTAPAWRPEAGHIIFGENDENFFGWSIPAPSGAVHVTLCGGGLDIDARGTGYIDRGWMNQPLADFMHDWNWYYTKFGDYTVAAITITFEEQYGHPAMSFFMVTRDGELLAGGPGTQNPDHISYTTGGTHIDAETGKPVIEDFGYEYRDGATRFTLSVQNSIPTQRTNWNDVLTGTEEEKSRASIYNGAELRFTGPATFTHYDGDRVVDTIHVDAGPFCELMYMGQPR